MLGRARRFILVGLIAVAGVAAAIAASGGTASTRPAAHKETVQQCLTTLSTLKAHAANLRKMRADVLAKRTFLYTVSHFEGRPIFMPVSVADFTDYITEELVLGAITPRQAVKAIQQLRQMTVSNLAALNDYIDAADSQVTHQRSRCASLGGTTTTTTTKPKPPSANAFTLQSGLTKVTNTHQSELTIDAAGRTAHFDNSHGGSAVWKIDYSWEVPQTITPGKTYTITLHEEILSVSPSQPLGDQMNALAPDFAQAIQAHWPDNPDVSKTFTVPLAADQKDSSDIAITIGFVSSGVTYHYRK